MKKIILRCRQWQRRVWRYQRGNQNPYITKKNTQHN